MTIGFFTSANFFAFAGFFVSIGFIIFLLSIGFLLLFILDKTKLFYIRKLIISTNNTIATKILKDII